MEQQRALLFIALSVIAFLMWQALQEDYAPKSTPKTESTATPPLSSEEIDSMPVPDATADIPTPGKQPTAKAAVVRSAGKRIVVETDVFRAEIDTLGGLGSAIEQEIGRGWRAAANRSRNCP